MSTLSNEYEDLIVRGRAALMLGKLGDPRAVERLVELCELFGIPVMETYRPAFLNFPRTHPRQSRYQPHRRSLAVPAVAGTVYPA